MGGNPEEDDRNNPEKRDHKTREQGKESGREYKGK
jgi:hypothetical protein